MTACRICGEDKPISKKDRDRRFVWCKDCAQMYELMKAEQKERAWQETQKREIERLGLNKTASFTVTFK